MDRIVLKRPLATYAPRYTHFITLLSKVKALQPANLNLWQVMDSAAFEDTETALEVALKEARTRKKFGQANER